MSLIVQLLDSDRENKRKLFSSIRVHLIMTLCHCQNVNCKVEISTALDHRPVHFALSIRMIFAQRVNEK